MGSQHPIRMNHLRNICFVGIVLVAFFVLICNGSSYGIFQPTPEDLCKCLPLEPDIADYRHLAKHVPISNISVQEIDVATILSWTQDPIMPPDALRTGREDEVFHVATAYLQTASVNGVDCDVTMEISSTPDKNVAPGWWWKRLWTPNIAAPVRIFR